DIDACAVLPDGSLVSSALGAFSVPGGASGTSKSLSRLSPFAVAPAPPPPGDLSGSGEDLIRFTPQTVGSFTSGTWSFYFDGSDVGLSGTSENVDAVAVLSDGRILLSTAGAASVPGVSAAADTDLLVFTPTSLGANTAGTWAQ